MPSVIEHIGSDGALRSLLSKIVNQQAVPIYPRTSSDVVEYNGSTVQNTLKDLQDWFGSLGDLTDSIIKDIETLNNNSLDKTYVIEKLDEVSKLITNNTSSIIDIRNTISRLSFYTRDEADQILSAFTDDINVNVSDMRTILTGISSFFENNYFNKDDITYRYDNLYNAIEDAKNIIRNEFNDIFDQFRANIGDYINRTMDSYTTEKTFNTKTSSIDENIRLVNNKVDILRGDTTVMNAESIAEVNQYTDKSKTDIVTNSNNNTYFIRNDISSSFREQNYTLDQKFSNMITLFGEINSSLRSRLDAIEAKLDGESSTEYPVYASADEEVY